MTDLFLSLVPFTPIGIYFMWYRAAANIFNKEQRFQAIATVRQRISALTGIPASWSRFGGRTPSARVKSAVGVQVF